MWIWNSDCENSATDCDGDAIYINKFLEFDAEIYNKYTASVSDWQFEHDFVISIPPHCKHITSTPNFKRLDISSALQILISKLYKGTFSLLYCKSILNCNLES